MPQWIDPMRIFMVGRLALLSGDLETAADAIEWACRLDPSNPVFREAAQGVRRRRDRRQATALLYREAIEAAGQVFGQAHRLAVHIADGFADDCQGTSKRGASRENCRRVLTRDIAPDLTGAAAADLPARQSAGRADATRVDPMSDLARYIHEMIEEVPSED